MFLERTLDTEKSRSKKSRQKQKINTGLNVESLKTYAGLEAEKIPFYYFRQLLQTKICIPRP